MAGAAEQESESDSESAALGQCRGRGPGHQQDEVFCPGCKARFRSLHALSCHRNSVHRRSTPCGLSLRTERRQRVSLRPCQATGAAADDSDWSDPDIREMMGGGNSHDLPAGAGRVEALPSRDRVSVPHPRCFAREQSEPGPAH
jgi:hypothetical protein